MDTASLEAKLCEDSVAWPVLQGLLQRFRTDPAVSVTFDDGTAVCGGCHQSQSRSQSSQIRARPKDLHLCDACGRLLIPFVFDHPHAAAVLERFLPNHTLEGPNLTTTAETTSGVNLPAAAGGSVRLTRTATGAQMSMLPGWTAAPATAGTEGGIWALGLEQVGLRLADEMLPGLTNQTVHARYYAMFAWAFWRFARTSRLRKRSVRAQEQRLWFRRVESAFRVASELAEPQRRALVGSRAIRNRWDQIDRAGGRVSLVNDAPASAWVPYGASFREMRCAIVDRDVVQLLRPTGVALAEAFDAQLRATRVGRALVERLSSRAQSLDVDLLRQASDVFALRQLEADEPEHGPALTDARTPHTLSGATSGHPLFGKRDEARSRTIGLFLEIARQSAGSLRESGEVHRVFAGGAFREGRTFRPPEIFALDFLRWQRYQERQHQKLALYGIWRDVNAVLLGRRGWWGRLPMTLLLHRSAAAASEVLSTWCGVVGRSPCGLTGCSSGFEEVRDWPDPQTTAPYALAQDLIGLSNSGTRTRRRARDGPRDCCGVGNAP